MRFGYRREGSVALAIGVLAAVLAAVSPSYFSGENLIDLILANLPVAVVALGTTLVMISGEIDISVGSVFAITGVVAGLVVKSQLPGGVWTATLAACAVGSLAGAISGAFVAYWRVPSIVVTLAMMVSLRDALRWATGGAWVQNLPAGFQWFGFPQERYPLIAVGVLVLPSAGAAWGLRYLAAGRMVYATGSNPSAARLSGIDVAAVKLGVFTLAGALTGIAAVLNAVRFNQVPSNGGIGLEMKVIAAVVVGGVSTTGGRGTIGGTLLGVVLLGDIGPALTFLGASAYWERAIQGAIILTAVAVDASRGRMAARKSMPAEVHA
jgi:rhamnose transport system permease protein